MMSRHTNWVSRSKFFRLGLGMCLFHGVFFGISSPAAIRYDDDGVLDSRLEVERWFINRVRHNPEAEADWIGMVNAANRSYDTCEDIDGVNDFGSGPAAWDPWIAPKGPVAPNATLSIAAENHCQDMAETGYFQHASPSSTYYPIWTQPWTRHTLEGYSNQISGYMENLATRAVGYSAGYPSQGGTPRQFYLDLFIDAGVASRGHRMSILNANAREIGLGWSRTQYTQSGYYWTRDYTTQDFGRRFGDHFFTGTMFYDADGSGEYDEGEGVGGIDVRLFGPNGESAWYDTSQSSGSFAVPIADLADGSRVTVRLQNSNNESKVLTVPFGYFTLGTMTLAAGEARDIASYFQPGDDRNIGFRNLELIVSSSITPSASSVHISFNSLPGVTYVVEAADGASGGTWMELETIIADTETEICVDDTLQPFRIYRVRIESD